MQNENHGLNFCWYLIRFHLRQSWVVMQGNWFIMQARLQTSTYCDASRLRQAQTEIARKKQSGHKSCLRSVSFDFIRECIYMYIPIYIYTRICRLCVLYLPCPCPSPSLLFLFFFPSLSLSLSSLPVHSFVWHSRDHGCDPLFYIYWEVQTCCPFPKMACV